MTHTGIRTARRAQRHGFRSAGFAGRPALGRRALQRSSGRQNIVRRPGSDRAPAHRLAACIGVPITANAVAAVAFHRHRGGPVQDLKLDLRHGPDVEVAAPVAQPIPGGMQAGQHQRAIWPQHPAQLVQGGHPVIDVFDRQRAQGQVDTFIGQPADPIAQVVHAELTLAYPGPADLHHPRAVVEPCHLRPATDQFGGIKGPGRTLRPGPRLPVTSPSSARQAGPVIALRSRITDSRSHAALRALGACNSGAGTAARAAGKNASLRLLPDNR